MTARIASVDEETVALHPELICVDTHPGLDGSHDDFIDRVHFAESGREKLAENVMAAIGPILQEDLKTR